MIGRCLVCGLDTENYPQHWRMHDTPSLVDPARTVVIERLNLTLRLELGLPAGSGAVTWPGPTVPARLPGIGDLRVDELLNVVDVGEAGGSRV